MIDKINYIFTKKDKAKMVLLLIAVVLGSFLELAAVAIFSPFIDIIVNPAEIADSKLWLAIYQSISFSGTEYFMAFMAGKKYLHYAGKKCDLPFFLPDTENHFHPIVEGIYEGTLYLPFKQKHIGSAKKHAGRH